MLRASCLKDVPLFPTKVPNICHGEMTAGCTNLHKTHASSLDVWEYEPGEFEWQVESNKSTCVLFGCAEVDLADGRQLSLMPGDAIFLPEGMHGRWVVKDRLRMVTVSIPD